MSVEKRTAIRLSDGRELIYFDEQPNSERGYPDTRSLPPPPATAQLRHDPLIDEWVAINAHRQQRTYLPPSDKCPLCPSTPDFASEIPAPDYDVVVFENQFPSFSDRIAPDEVEQINDMVPVRPASDAARWSASPATTTRRSARSHPSGSERWSTRSPTGPSRCPR